MPRDTSTDRLNGLKDLLWKKRSPQGAAAHLRAFLEGGNYAARLLLPDKVLVDEELIQEARALFPVQNILSLDFTDEGRRADGAV